MDLVGLLELLEGLTDFVRRHNRSIGFECQRNRRVRERTGLPAEKLFRSKKVRKRRMKRRVESARKKRLEKLGR